MTSEMLGKLHQAVMDGDIQAVPGLAQQGVSAGLAPQELIDGGLLSGMSAIGKLFREEQVFVPEVLVAAKAMQAGLNALEPHLARGGVKFKGTAVIGTVHGDLHDIGKNLVIMLWQGAGLKVHDLGMNVPPERFVAAIHEHRPNLVGMSCLLTTTMPAIEATLKALNAAGVRKQVRVILGGQPVTRDWAMKAGADGWAPDAGRAVDEAMGLLGK